MDLEFIDAEARKKYTTRRQNDLLRCRECLERRDFATIETIGHNLKGNGISFGYPELSQLGEQIEISARDSNSTAVLTLIDRLEKWIDSQPSQYRD